MSFFEQPHIGFVIAAYAIAAVVISALIGMTLRDHVKLRRALSAREAATPGNAASQLDDASP